MAFLQQLLMYSTVAMAVAYLLWKFVLPKTIFSKKPKKGPSCGEGDCGCH